MHRHAFYPRRGRQRCTLLHIMPLYNVYLLFTTCAISPILRATTEKIREREKSPVVFCTLVRQSHLRTTLPTRQSTYETQPINNSQATSHPT
ncbi:hypothetical protein SFRURICE_004168 [Spodoptera frugiperda]|nr:hypothetical protein SFRURICE_004168 [Spodoptera frugiperda]